MDHRSSKRHTINVTADLKCNGQSHHAQFSDISSGGAKIALEKASIPKDTAVVIDLPYLNKIEASVAWAHGKKLGLKFANTQNELNEFLYNLAIYGFSSSMKTVS